MPLVTFASDVVTSYELHRADPMLGMQIAHTRVDPEYPLDPASYPGSRRPQDTAQLARETLLAGYTINAAKQLRQDDRLGSIEPGKIANLTILSADPLTAEPRGAGSHQGRRRGLRRTSRPWVPATESVSPMDGRSRRCTRGHTRLLDDSGRAGVWPDSVQVIGGKLSMRLPTR